MRFINVYSLVRLSPLTLLLLLAQVPLYAQDAAGSDENPGADDELQGISLQDSKHVNDPVFEDDVPEDLGPLPEAQPSDEDRLLSLFKLYRDAVNDAMYAEADTLGKQIVELTISMHGVDSSETAKAITNLAIAQHGSGQFESAKLNFNASVEIIERISDRLNEDLINPLKGLAASELALGNTP